MQPLIEHSTVVAGFRTRVLELEGEGPGLVALHGWGDSADTWRPLLAVLGERDRRAIAVDLPGYGHADRVREGEVLPPFDVVRRDAVVRRLLALPFPLPGAVMKTAVGTVYRRLAFSAPGAADPALVASFAGHHAGRAQVARLLDSGRRLLPELQSPPADLAAIECPVLLVWGTRDRMVPHSGARVLLEAVAGTEVALLEGVGRCPQLEATDRLAELLLRFIISR